MHVIALPGRNPQTESWMTQLVKTLEIGQDQTDIIHYKHWDEGGQPDVPYEVARLKDLTPDLVIAKSIGTMLCMRAYGTAGFRPFKTVFIGLPLRAFAPFQKQNLVNICRQVPTLCIQQTADANGSYAQVSALLADVKLCNIVEVPGGDHAYSDLGELKRLIETWLISH